MNWNTTRIRRVKFDESENITTKKLDGWYVENDNGFSGMCIALNDDGETGEEILIPMRDLVSIVDYYVKNKK